MPASDVVDVGCGTGRLQPYLAARACPRGIDLFQSTGSGAARPR
jgi:2-polyprenyl-3-methyl-5-hydroxy-6-metoxy-1,4-benzoquinol methylase